MKNLYIPKGKTLHYETLYCQNIVNDGTLIVDGTLHARSISGKGILKAGTVSVRHVAEMDIECATMNGETMAAERVCAAEIVLSGSATVSCYLEAEYVEVPKLTMAKHNIGTLKADDVITLPEKKRGIVGTLVAGFFRRLWLSVIHRIPVDAPYVQVAAPAPESTDTEQEQPKPERAGDFQSQPVTQPMDLDLEEDFEFKRLKAMYRLLKDCGYTLRITKQEETVLTPREDIRRQRLIFVGEIVVPNGLDLPQIAVGPGPVQHGIQQRAFPVPPGNGIGLLSPVAADPVLYCALILLVEQLEELGVFFAQREIVLFHVPRCAS